MGRNVKVSICSVVNLPGSDGAVAETVAEFALQGAELGGYAERRGHWHLITEAEIQNESVEMRMSQRIGLKFQLSYLLQQFN